MHSFAARDGDTRRSSRVPSLLLIVLDMILGRCTIQSLLAVGFAAFCKAMRPSSKLRGLNGRGLVEASRKRAVRLRPASGDNPADSTVVRTARVPPISNFVPTRPSKSNLRLNGE